MLLASRSIASVELVRLSPEEDMLGTWLGWTIDMRCASAMMTEDVVAEPVVAQLLRELRQLGVHPSVLIQHPVQRLEVVPTRLVAAACRGVE